MIIHENKTIKSQTFACIVNFRIYIEQMELLKYYWNMMSSYEDRDCQRFSKPTIMEKHIHRYIHIFSK